MAGKVSLTESMICYVMRESDIDNKLNKIQVTKNLVFTNLSYRSLEQSIIMLSHHLSRNAGSTR